MAATKNDSKMCMIFNEISSLVYSGLSPLLPTMSKYLNIANLYISTPPLDPPPLRPNSAKLCLAGNY